LRIYINQHLSVPVLAKITPKSNTKGNTKNSAWREP
jgi:hypothetical protein